MQRTKPLHDEIIEAMEFSEALTQIAGFLIAFFIFCFSVCWIAYAL